LQQQTEERSAPQQTAPQQTTPEQSAPQQASPQQTAPEQEAPEKPTSSEAERPATRAEEPAGLTLSERAWRVLKAGAADENKDKRAAAIRVLGLVRRDQRAQQAAERALSDKEAEVRAAGASALGQMGSRKSRAKLRRALNDKDSEVVFAAASSLRVLGDRSAYRVYYAVLTGKMKSGQGLIEEQKEKFKDPKKMAVFGFEQGIGFVPFAGLGYKAFKMLKKDDSSPVRAAAAKVLAEDPDARAAEALVEAAAEDNSWVVRTAALDAIAHRGDASLLPKITRSLSDDKEEVRFTAAAAVLRLSQENSRKKASGGRSSKRAVRR
jgi:HEAT repeat protein